ERSTKSAGPAERGELPHNTAWLIGARSNGHCNVFCDFFPACRDAVRTSATPKMFHVEHFAICSPNILGFKNGKAQYLAQGRIAFSQSSTSRRRTPHTKASSSFTSTTGEL